MINCFAIPTSSKRESPFWPQDNSISPDVKCKTFLSRCLRGALLLSLAFLSLTFTACVRQQSVAQSAELSTYHQGSLELPDNPNAPKLIYVDCREGAQLAPHLNNHLEKALQSGKFRLADSPSNAGYILHVNILGQGDVAPDALKAAVNAGYGSSARFSGSGSNAMLVDALMVQRRIPAAGRPSRQRLKNISARNALDSSQMRIGILADGKKHDQEEFSAAIARELALKVAR